MTLNGLYPNELDKILLHLGSCEKCAWAFVHLIAEHRRFEDGKDAAERGEHFRP